MRVDDLGEDSLRLIFGGKDHKTGQESSTEKSYEALHKDFRDWLPDAASQPIESQWSGQVIETPDGLPYIGEHSKRHWVATGYAGNGTSFGSLAGKIISDGILGRENKFAGLFSPSRKPLRTGRIRYLEESKDFPFYFVKDRALASEPPESLEDLQSGEGFTAKTDGEWMAISKDNLGKLHAVSALCTHLNCRVHWNSAETIWDCPCHGSRFQPTGEIISGPAEEVLRPLSLNER